jgi:hypothetical protein
MKWFNFLSLIFMMVLTGCGHNPSEARTVAADPDRGGIERFGKSDIDEVIELHQRTAIQNIKQLMVKLYRRNPSQRQDKQSRTIDESVELVFAMPLIDLHPLWQQKQGSEIIHLAFDEKYQGDRVFAYIVGLRKMLMTSYDNHIEFYYFTSINEQKLYNSARNIEIAAWMLANRKDRAGQHYLLSDSLESDQRNLSYQRLIGKLIATQDNIANIIDHREGRLIRTAVVRAASMIFLPI